MAIYSYLAREFGDDVELALFDLSDCADDAYDLLDRYDVASFDLVGFCAYSTNFPIVREWALQLRARGTHAKIVVGGPHATALPQHIAMHHRDAFDFVVRGEGERPMAAIIRSLLSGSRPPRVPGVVYKDPLGIVSVGTTDPVPDLNTVPTPIAPVRSPYSQEVLAFDRKEMRMRRAVPFTTSRGCPFSCTFCSIRASDSKWRSVNAERLGEWIADARVQDPTFEHVNFMDADFLIDRKRVIAIGDMFAARFPELTWSFSGRVDDLRRLGEPALAKLVTQGLRAVEVGFESGSQEMLDRLGKRVKVQENYDAVAMLQRLDLDMLIDFILFLPDETPEQLRESLTFLRRTGLTDYLPHDHFFTHLVQYPSTPLRVHYEKLFDVQFSKDVLPEPDDLFEHPGTKQIYKFFVVEFQPMAARLRRIIEAVDAAAIAFRESDAKLAQYLRIEAVSLRHLPFQVLDALIDHHEGATLLDAVPWLARFHDHIGELEALCRQQPTHVAA
jgi:radical SAM superfamily enzyme YgiQ (UPF0313 family)